MESETESIPYTRNRYMSLYAFNSLLSGHSSHIFFPNSLFQDAMQQNYTVYFYNVECIRTSSIKPKLAHEISTHSIRPTSAQNATSIFHYHFRYSMWCHKKRRELKSDNPKKRRKDIGFGNVLDSPYAQNTCQLYSSQYKSLCIENGQLECWNLLTLTHLNTSQRQSNGYTLYAIREHSKWEPDIHPYDIKIRKCKFNKRTKAKKGINIHDIKI